MSEDVAEATASTEALPASVTLVERDGTTYYLVGTAHVSQRSVDDVKAVIDQVKPDVVCVELDQARHNALTNDSAFRDLDVFKVVREGRGLYLLAHLALASYQRRIGQSLGVKPGAELLAACSAATKRGVPVELVDRDINITLRRTWKNLGLWKRTTLMSSLVFGWGDDDEPANDDEDSEGVTADTVEALKEPKALSEMLAELGNAVPQIKGPLIDERDKYLVSKIRDAGKGKQRVVAVVGAAHVPGMVEQFDAKIDRAKLEVIPPPSVWWKILKWGVPIVFLAALLFFWQRSDSVNLGEVMLAWMVPTAVGAALGTLLSGGSIFSVASSIVAAPIAKVYPLVRTGVVVGVVEAWRRKPSVVDCEQLPEDIQNFKGFWRNPVTRILLVAVASGLGAAIGFWVGVGWVASML